MGKKLIVTLMATCMLIASFPAAAVEFTDTISTEYEKAISIVSDLGFMEGYPDGTFQAEEPITRAEFAEVVIRMLGMDTDDAIMGVQPYFYDVPSTHWASGCINAAAAMQIISGDPGGYFRPDDNITMAEATKVLIHVLGYEYFAQSSGGYPGGYIMQASTTGLSRSITANQNDDITRAQTAQFLYNAMDIPILQSVSFGESIELRKEDGITFLSEYHDIYQGRGVVTANAYTKINGESSVPEGMIEIDGEQYDVENTNADGLLGQRVEFYYVDDARDDEKTLKAILPLNNAIYEINGEDLAGDSTISQLQVFRDGKKERYSVAPDANIIYNGKYDGKMINADMNEFMSDTTKLELVDNGDDGTIDVIFMTKYQNMVVSGVNAANQMVSFLFDQPSLHLDDSSIHYTVTKKSGAAASLSDLQPRTLVSVAKSRNFEDETASSKMVEIVICDDIISGTVSAIGDDFVTLQTVVNKEDVEMDYPVSSQFISENGTVIQNGFRGAFHIDLNGKIGFFDQTGSSLRKFGYILAAGKEGAMSTNYEMKLLTSAGTVEYFKTAARIVVDGTARAGDEMYRILQDNTQVVDEIKLMVRYSTNASGEINYLDTLSPNSDQDVDALTEEKITASGGMRYQSQSKMLVSYNEPTRYIINDSVTVFVIPEGNVDDDEYKVYGSSYFVNQSYYGDPSSGETFTMYNVKDSVPAAISMLVQSVAVGIGGIDTGQDPMGVVMKKSRAVDESMENYTNLVVYINGQETKISVTESTKIVRKDESGQVVSTRPGGSEPLTVDDLEFGDLFLYDMDAQNRASVIYKINTAPVWEYSATGDQRYTVSGMSGYEELIFGSVRKKDDTALGIDVSLEKYLYINVVSSPNICIVDQVEETVEAATLQDVQASLTDEEADKVFVRNRFGGIKDIIIFR